MDDGTVTSPRTPDPTEVMEALGGPLALIYEGMEASTLHAREYFDAEDREIDWTLAPCLVRSHLKHFLTQKGQRVEELEAERLANNGLLYRFNEYRIRILKTHDGTIPVPGRSKKRQDYFSQVPTQYSLTGWSLAYRGEEREPETNLNLVVLWDVNHEYDLGDLYLALPKSGKEPYGRVETHWTHVVPHPATGEAANTSAPDEHDEPEDLPLTVKETRSTGANDAG